MSNSLKDQLIALGLADKHKAGKKASSRKPSEKPHKKPSRKSTGNTGGDVSLDQAYRLRKQEEKQSVQAKKEQKRFQDLQRRRVNKQIQELVDTYALNDRKAELKRNFLYKGRIRSVLCTPEQLKALNGGELGVVFLRGNYLLMLPEHVELVRAVSEDHIPDLGGNEPDDEDDEHKVPDDLVW